MDFQLKKRTFELLSPVIMHWTTMVHNLDLSSRGIRCLIMDRSGETRFTGNEEVWREFDSRAPEAEAVFARRSTEPLYNRTLGR